MDLASYADGMQGKLIAAARSLLGWGQVELARRAEISQPTLRALENETGNPTRASEQKVLTVLRAKGIQFEEAPGRISVSLVWKPE
jgi:transcriptional regulator with XRE-family HTH domain